MSRIGEPSSCRASGAGCETAVGVVERWAVIDEYRGTSMGDMDDAGSHDGKCSPSGTCAPPFWKYGTIGTVQLA
jgi:hypothetical protein